MQVRAHVFGVTQQVAFWARDSFTNQLCCFLEKNINKYAIK